MMCPPVKFEGIPKFLVLCDETAMAPMGTVIITNSVRPCLHLQTPEPREDSVCGHGYLVYLVLRLR